MRSVVHPRRNRMLGAYNHCSAVGSKMRRQCQSLIGLVIALAIVLAPSLGWSDSSCTATNDNGDQTCSISCPTGQSASCQNGTGSTAPVCSCSGMPDNAGRTVQHVFRVPSSKGLFKFVVPSVEKLTSAPSVTTSTNLIDVINAKLSTLPDHHVSDSCHEEHDMCPGHQICRCCVGGREMCFGGAPYPCHSRQVCTPIMGKLTIAPPLNVVKGPTITLGPVDFNSIPTSVLTGRGTYRNCSTIQQSETFTHTEQIAEGDTITKTSSLQSGRTENTSITGSIKLYVISVGGTSSLQLNTTTTYTQSDAENHTQSKIEQVQIPLLAPAKSLTTISHSFIVYHIPIPFTGTITVDGPVSPNLDGVNSLSQILPNDADRTFSFSGVVTDSTLIDTQVSANQKPLSDSECAGDSHMTIEYLGRE